MTTPTTAVFVLGLWIVAVFPASVRAQEAATTPATSSPGSPREFSLGIGAGWCEPNDYSGGLYLSGAARVHAADSIVLEPELGYFESTRVHPGYSSFERKDFSASLALLFQSKAERLRFSAGPGLGMHSTSTTVDYAPDLWGGEAWTLHYSDTKLGIHVQAGLDVAIGRRLWAYGLLRYDLLKGEAQNESKALAGVRYRFPRSRP